MVYHQPKLTVVQNFESVLFSALGNAEYDDDHFHWPQHPKEWMGHSAISIITTKVIFAIFLEGLLRVTDIVQNPLSTKATAISETLLRKL